MLRFNIHLLKKLTARTLIHLYLIVASLFGLFPFVWSLSTSFKSKAEIYSPTITLFPRHPTLINYKHVIRGVGGISSSAGSYTLILYRNSIVVSGFVVLFTVLIASLAGYAFARLKFRGRDAIFAFFMILMFLPSGGTLMATYVLMRHLHLLDSLLGLILLFTGGGGVSLFLMRQIFLNIPSEIEDAAKVDGASNTRIAFQIMFPMATSGMVMVAIMTFISVWGEWLVTRTLIRTAEKLTLTAGIATVVMRMGGETSAAGLVSNYGLRATVVGLVVIPVVLVFIFLQKWFIRGAAEGLKL